RRLGTTAPSYFFITPPSELERRLTGRCFTALERYGKYLVGKLNDDSSLLLHLGMTGQLFAAGANNPRLLRRTSSATLNPGLESAFQPDVHTHLIFEFDDSPRVFFRDARKFGKVEWLPAGKTSS